VPEAQRAVVLADDAAGGQLQELERGLLGQAGQRTAAEVGDAAPAALGQGRDLPGLRQQRSGGAGDPVDLGSGRRRTTSGSR
jgi:hypothetical protein